MRRLGFLLLAFYIVFLGGSSYYYQIFAVRIAHHVIITAGLLAWLLIRLRQQRGLPPGPLNIPLYAAVGVWLLASALALDPRIAFESTWFLITHVLLLFVFIDLIQSGRGRLLMEAQLMIGALVVIVAAAQAFTWFFGSGGTLGWSHVLGGDLPFPPVLPRLDQPFGVSTWLSAYTAPLITVAATYALTVRRRDYKPALWGLAVALLITLFLSSSRGGFLSLAVAIVILLGFRLWNDRRIPRITFIGAGLLVIVAASAVILFISRDPSRVSGDLLRFDLWRSSVELFTADPLTGVGVGNFGRALREVRDPVAPDDRFSTAHSLYLNTAAETGIPGVIVGVTCIVVIGLAWFRQWRNAEGFARRLRLEGLFAALVGLAVHSTFDMFTSTALVSLPLILIAFCITPPRSLLDPPLKGQRIPAGVAAVIVAAFGGFLIFISDRAQAAFNTSVANDDLAAAQTAAAIDPALRLYTLQVEYLTARTADDPQQAIAAYQRALDLEPTWDSGWINLAALYESQGEYAQAAQALTAATRINYTNGSWYGWARIAETHDLAAPDAISDAYLRTLIFPPLNAEYWTATDLRRQTVERYAAEQNPEVRWRTLNAIFPDQGAAMLNRWQDQDDPQLAPAENHWMRSELWLARAAADPTDQALVTALNEINAALRLTPARGDFYVTRARIRYAQGDHDGARLDLNRASLLGIYYERDTLPILQIDYAVSEQQRVEMAIRALSSQAISQNFEGVLFQGRRANFQPDARMITPGTPFVQPYFELADYFLSVDDSPRRAVQVYRLILSIAPFNEQAQAALATLEGSS